MSRRVTFAVWLARLLRSGAADRFDGWRVFGLPFTRERVVIIVAWRRNYGAPAKAMPMTGADEWSRVKHVGGTVEGE